MKTLIRFLCLPLFAVLLATAWPSGAAQADDEITSLGDFGAWSAFSFNDEDGNKVCYMASVPTKAEGNYTRRGDVHALITHRPAENTSNVFSYITGYDYKDGSEPTVTIDNDSFKLFTEQDTAWAPDPQTDNRIAESIRKGSRMVVKGTSSRGTLTTDTFSLSGSGAAHDAINKACGI